MSVIVNILKLYWRIVWDRSIRKNPFYIIHLQMSLFLYGHIGFKNFCHVNWSTTKMFFLIGLNTFFCLPTTSLDILVAKKSPPNFNKRIFQKWKVYDFKTKSLLTNKISILIILRLCIWTSLWMKLYIQLMLNTFRNDIQQDLQPQISSKKSFFLIFT